MMDQPDAVVIETTNTSSLIPFRPAASGARTKATCPACGLVLLKRTLQRHMRTKHPNASTTSQLTQAFRCLHCGDSFMRRDNLDRHVLTQHDNKNILVDCANCGAQVRERSLDDHFKSQKCQKAQRPSQNRNCFGAWEAAAASLVCPRRFGPETVLHPLTVPWFIYKTLLLDDLALAMVEYLEIRGLAMRTIARALGRKDTNATQPAALALSLLLSCDFDQMLPPESYAPFFSIASSLEKQSPGHYSLELVDVEDDLVHKVHKTTTLRSDWRDQEAASVHENVTEVCETDVEITWTFTPYMHKTRSTRSPQGLPWPVVSWVRELTVVYWPPCESKSVIG